ncbi:hypothetical protein BFL43_18490 [Williamsia sp. 1135]|nr:hypothetical protein BFL43_18490 [Williamsia sp. 1135]
MLIENELATICGSDVHTVGGRRTTPVPTILGHEAVGRVVSAGPGAAATPGDRVVWTVGTACGMCRRCSRGVPQKCVNVRKYGHEATTDAWTLNGAFASHVPSLPVSSTACGLLQPPRPVLAAAGAVEQVDRWGAAKVAGRPNQLERDVGTHGRGVHGDLPAAVLYVAERRHVGAGVRRRIGVGGRREHDAGDDECCCGRQQLEPANRRPAGRNHGLH